MFCEKHSGISRATFFRYKQKLKNLSLEIFPPSKKPIQLRTPNLEESKKQLVLRIRRENPTYGKAKIAIILKRNFASRISESTVGRILKHFQEKDFALKSLSEVRKKRKRNFTKGHAQPWKYKEYRDIVIGERVQIDHMTITKSEVYMKHFQGWDRRSKFIMAGMYHHAKSSLATRLLLDLVEKAPFKILSIQVDGDIEFMAEFEEVCEKLEIPLIFFATEQAVLEWGRRTGKSNF